MELANDSSENTRGRLEMLLEKYVDYNMQEEIHFGIFREYLSTDRDTLSARGILAIMKQRYTGRLTELAELIMEGNMTSGIINKPMHIENKSELPVEYLLKGNYPNPFNPETSISYTLESDSWVNLSVYDLTGAEVAVLVNSGQQGGSYTVQFNASELASGVYLMRLNAVGMSGKVVSDTKKMVLMR